VARRLTTWTIGRSSSTLVLLAVAALVLIATALPQFMHVGSVHVVDWIGMLVYLGAPVAWISGIIHWVTSFSGSARRIWGVVVVLGFVPGAIAYWFLAAPRTTPS
jgi:hypothetical protein